MTDAVAAVRLLAVSLLMAGLATSLLVPPVPVAQAAGECPPHLPVREEFPSVGLFGYSANANSLDERIPAHGGGAGDAALLEGPSVVCRQFVNPSPQCFETGSGTAPAIETELLSMQLAGSSSAGLPLVVGESPTMVSTGQVGNADGQIPLTCRFDPRMGRWAIQFDGLVDSFFDVFAVVDLGGQPARNHVPFHVVDKLCGLTWAAQDVVPCQPERAYMHTGGPRAMLTAIQGGMQADFACHMPFFVPVPPPSTCGGASGPAPDGRWTVNPFRVYVAEVTGQEIVSVETASWSAPPGTTLTITDWRDLTGDGTWEADVLVIPPDQQCPGGGTIPIEIVALSLVSSSPLPLETKIVGEWCQGP